MAASAVVYAGLVMMFAGLIALVRPIRWVGLPTRRRATLAALAGVCVVAIGALLPTRMTRVAGITSRLDEIIPAYQFNELHSLRVEAAPEQVYRAMRDVTAGEISLFQLLTSIRRFGRPTRESILNAPDSVPIIDVAARTGFMVLADDAPRELVVGTVVLAPDGWRRSHAPTPAAFTALTGAGFATAVMNFRIVPDGPNASRLSTETRVFATDASAARRFALYWRVIYPGSALIRRMWLRAIGRRAESR
jgi:hypothetical protein